MDRATKQAESIEHAAACARLRKAIEIAPLKAELHFQLAVLEQQSGDLEAAIHSYQRALELNPSIAEALNNLGSAFREKHRFADAVRAYHRAIELRPGFADAYRNLGNAWLDQDRFEVAVPCYRQALLLQPENVDEHVRFALLLHEHGHLETAAEAYRRVLALRPNAFESLNNLGCILQQLGQFDEAREVLERARHLGNGVAEVWLNSGNLHLRQGQFEAARASYRQAVVLRPDYVEAHRGLGNAYKEECRLGEALASYQQALLLAPDQAQSHADLGSVLQELSRFEEALQAYRHALRLDSTAIDIVAAVVYLQQLICQWDGLNELTQRLLVELAPPDADHRLDQALASVAPESTIAPETDAEFAEQALIPPFLVVGLAVETTPAQQFRCAERWARQLYKHIPRHRHAAARSPGYTLHRKLRIGYLSGDFRMHSVAYMIPELFEQHDRTGFEIFAYSIGPDDQSPIRRRIQQAVDGFRELRPMSYREAADRIMADQIDILIDLQGYTTLSRTEIVALRPAPIQVSYLGYPGTMGGDIWDYILADDYVVPLDQQAYYSEKLVHLPISYQVNDSQHAIAQYRPSRQECDLPDDAIIFCSFNNSYKITPNLFDVWMRLLRDTPESILWLPDRDTTTTANLKREAAARGIASDRLRFAKTVPLDEHLARQPLADLFLDSFPYNGHATSSIALRMGVPIVTLSGAAFASRVSGSLLRAVGLSELITENIGDYEAVAKRLARDRSQLARFRTRLAKQLVGCPLFDGQQFARNVEKAYQAMWEVFLRGDPPRHIAVKDGPDGTLSVPRGTRY